MYSEVFKQFGWLHPTAQSSLQFKFTYLGLHVANAIYNPKELVEESFLGIVFPNQVLDVKFTNSSRPFYTILRTMRDLGGYLIRDEMICGPMNLSDDLDQNEYTEMLRVIRSTRGDSEQLNKLMLSCAQTNQIKENTMKNYTRLPLAALLWSGWAEKVTTHEIYNKKMSFLKLTAKGLEKLKELENYEDVRALKLEINDIEGITALSRLGFYEMLSRAGFDVSIVSEQMGIYSEVIKQKYSFSSNILFSPFQELGPDLTERIFPNVMGNNVTSSRTFLPTYIAETGRVEPGDHFYVSINAPQKIDANALLISIFDQNINNLTPTNYEQEIIPYLDKFRLYNKEQFYPLISVLFNLLGFNCECSRAGDNYQRWDAIIIDESNSVPIEIKSPGEEEFISVKAIRQAFENKIILLARKQYQTNFSTTSLAVGYNLPNERSEVDTLIRDIYNVFSIRIGVIDIKSLVYLVLAKCIWGASIELKDIRNLHGFIRIDYL